MMTLDDIHQLRAYINIESVRLAIETDDTKVMFVKRDFLYRSGRSFLENSRSAFLRCASANPQILVLGHSDISTTPTSVAPFRALGVRAVYCNNATRETSFLRALPLGLCPPLTISTTHEINGNSELVREAYFRRASNPSPSRHLVLVSANTATAPKHREPLAAIATSHGNAHITPLTLDYSLSGRETYLDEVANSDFVACPRGNGIDTHRLWETIYLGSIPIVLKQHMPVKGLDMHLPILVVDDWSRILDAAFLRRCICRIRSKRYDYSSVSLKYWVDAILSSSTLKVP
jgi:hypothetical protein